MQFISLLSAPSASCTPLILTENVDCFCQAPQLWILLDGSLEAVHQKNTLWGGNAEPGECIFLNPGTKILILPKTAVLLQISFLPEQFWAFFTNPAVAVQPIHLQKDPLLFQYGLHYGKYLLESSANDPAHGAGLLTQLLCRLDRLFHAHEDEMIHDELTVKQNRLLQKILRYINTHYTETISLADTACSLSVTPQYLASFFKKAKHCTFLEYVQDIRRQMTSLKDFTPNSYALNLSESLSGHAITFEQVLPYISRYASFSKVSEPPHHQCQKVIANTAFGQDFPDSWKKLINLGYASDFANIQLFQQLIRVQKEIGFAYGRICRIFDLITVYSIENQTIYDYNRIFRIFDVMIDHHMLPFLEVSNKIFRIQLSLLENVPLHMGKEITEYYNHLLILLPDFIRACINRYGQENFDQWRFEISYNNYDFIETAENFSFHKYMLYYQKILSVIRSYSSSCKVGGPGFNQWDNPQKLEDILEQYSSYQIEPDFITAYVYPLTSDGSTASLSPDEDLSLKRMQFLRDLICKRHKNLELWITEFNSNLSARNLLNDSSYQSVFLAKLLTTAVRMDIKAMGYYLLSDLPLRYADSLDLFFGGWGLFTDSDLPKPSYHAYSMFSMLGRRLLNYHENYLITANSDSSFQCFFYHYEHIRPEYYQKNILRSNLDGTDLFIKTDDHHWEVTIEQVPAGTYLLKEYTVSESAGNLLAIWKQLSFAAFSKELDLHALHLLGSLQPKLTVLDAAPDHILSVPLTLTGHQVKLLLIDWNHHEQEVPEYV